MGWLQRSSAFQVLGKVNGNKVVNFFSGITCSTLIISRKVSECAFKENHKILSYSISMAHTL